MRRRRHRQYGISNANQVLLAVVVCALLFLALLRRRWLDVDADESSAHAGLWGLYVSFDNETTSLSWGEFCDGNRTLPLQPNERQPLSAFDTQVLCETHATGARVPTMVRAAVATGIGFGVLSVVAAIYLHFGNPSREQIFWVGPVPGLALAVAAVLGTAVLIVWQAYYGMFDNGDCFTITVAATVIAYLVAISMLIRYRWPGVCAVATEQQALTARAPDGYERFRRRRLQRVQDDATINTTPVSRAAPFLSPV